MAVSEWWKSFHSSSMVRLGMNGGAQRLLRRGRHLEEVADKVEVGECGECGEAAQCLLAGRV
jgi:hypothetical protein